MNKKINSVRCSSLALRTILITDNVHQIMIETFEKSGYTCDYFPDYNSDQVLNSIEKYVGIIINSKTKIFRKEIDRAKKLKFIGRLGSGMEIIDVEYAKSKGIKSFSVPEANCDAVGEHAIGMLLSLFNNLNNADKEVRNFQWNREKNRGFEISGKTIGIIGCGNMGYSFAKKLKGFDARVIAYDKYKKSYGDSYVEETDLCTLQKEADILSMHVPLTEETRYMFNQSFIDTFHKKFFLINTARGPIVDTKSLISGLQSQKIKGAVLDVLEYEESSFEKIDLNTNTDFQTLIKFHNVLLSPHIAGWTIESKFKLSKVLADKIIADFS